MAEYLKNISWVLLLNSIVHISKKIVSLNVYEFGNITIVVFTTKNKT